MRLLIPLLAVASTLISPAKASPFPQAVTELLSATGSPPEECSTSHPSIFGIAAFRLPSGPDGTPEDRQRIAPRQEDGCTTITVTAGDGASTPTPAPAPPPPPLIPISQIGDGQIQAPPQPAPLADPATTPPPAAADDQQDVFPFANPAAPSATTLTITPTSTSTFPSNPPSTPSASRVTACLTPSTLLLHLSSSVLLDAQNRTGYIASNYQFQFDGPPQSGSLYTAGWAVCGNGSLTLGSSARFWQCRSGGFFNLYDRWWAEQCEEVRLLVVEQETEGTAGLGECEGIWE